MSNLSNKIHHRLKRIPLYKRRYRTGFTPLDNKHPTGFTLIELMIVMAIIAILVVLGIIAISTARKATRNTQRQDIARRIQMGLEEWYIAYKSYPLEDSDGANAERGFGTPCGGGISVDRLFYRSWDGHGNLTQFITNPLMDPRGFDVRTSYQDDCNTDPDRAFIRVSYRYKWVSPSSYGIRGRNELVRPNCNDPDGKGAGIRFDIGTLNPCLDNNVGNNPPTCIGWTNTCGLYPTDPTAPDPLKAEFPEFGSFLFKIE